MRQTNTRFLTAILIARRFACFARIITSMKWTGSKCSNYLFDLNIAFYAHTHTHTAKSTHLYTTHIKIHFKLYDLDWPSAQQQQQMKRKKIENLQPWHI